MVVTELKTGQDFCKSSTQRVALVNEEFGIGILIMEEPGTEQETQVLFLHKHFLFGLAEYLDTDSLWVRIPQVYLFIQLMFLFPNFTAPELSSPW